ncbi:alpha/beta fold hydrolase [Dactylosporangium sp. NPDC049742]|uniref:alpha/beta fold hydrolase n=1 Tax=Dactylosporangium sp. NPDC049742 TaxID=3154737 RepID=UPI0034456958
MGTVVSSPSVRLPDGARLYSVLHTPDPAPAAHGAARTPITVVLLHGWTLDNRLWRQQIADLPARLATFTTRPVQLLAFDLRGHGRSSATSGTDATLEQLGDDLAEVVTQLVPEGPVVLVGHSLGGMAIMEYAQRHATAFAARVVGVALISTSAEGSSRTSYGLSPRLARVMRILEIQGAGLLARSGAWRPHRRLMPLLSPGVRWLVFGDRVDTSWVALTASMVGNAPLCAIGGFRPSVDLHHRVETLAAMRGLPVAVLVGTLDRLTPPACAATITGELPDAELITCDDAGHMLPIERPDAVTDAIAGVIRRAANTIRMARHRPRAATPPPKAVKVPPTANPTRTTVKVTPTATSARKSVKVTPTANPARTTVNVTPTPTPAPKTVKVTPTAPSARKTAATTPTAPSARRPVKVPPTAPAARKTVEVTPTAPTARKTVEVTPTAPAARKTVEVTATTLPTLTAVKVTPTATADVTSGATTTAETTTTEPTTAESATPAPTTTTPAAKTAAGPPRSTSAAAELPPSPPEATETGTDDPEISATAA